MNLSIISLIIAEEHCAIAYHQNGAPYICAFAPVFWADGDMVEEGSYHEIKTVPCEIRIGHIK